MDGLSTVAADDVPKHPVLASVLMGILRALDDESSGKSSSSSSNDDVACRRHDRREPPCRGRTRHWKSPKAEETENVEEYVIPASEEWASTAKEIPISDSIRSPPESPKLHTILETEEDGEGDGDGCDDRRIVGRSGSDVEERKAAHATRENDAVKHLQNEAIKACSSTSSPLITSEDSDVAAFLSKQEYETLFGAKSGQSDKIFIPSRFVQDHGVAGPTSSVGSKSPLKRGSDEDVEVKQTKRMKSDDPSAKSPSLTPKRKLQSLMDKEVQKYALGTESLYRRRVSEPGANSSDRETPTPDAVCGGLKDNSGKENPFIGSGISESPSQRKRLKTEDESDFSSDETLYSDVMTDDTIEESTTSSVHEDRQVKNLGRRKKKLTKTLKSLKIDSSCHDGMSDFSSDGQTSIASPSSARSAPRSGLGTYGWNSHGRTEAKRLLQKAVSSSLEDLEELASADKPLSSPRTDSRGRTRGSESITSASLRPVSGSGGTGTESETKTAASDASKLISDASSQSSNLKSVDDKSSQKVSSEFSDLTTTSSDFKSASSVHSASRKKYFPTRHTEDEIADKEAISTSATFVSDLSGRARESNGIKIENVSTSTLSDPSELLADFKTQSSPVIFSVDAPSGQIYKEGKGDMEQTSSNFESVSSKISSSKDQLSSSLSGGTSNFTFTSAHQESISSKRIIQYTTDDSGLLEFNPIVTSDPARKISSASTQELSESQGTAIENLSDVAIVSISKLKDDSYSKSTSVISVSSDMYEGHSKNYKIDTTYTSSDFKSGSLTQSERLSNTDGENDQDVSSGSESQNFSDKKDDESLMSSETDKVRMPLYNPTSQSIQSSETNNIHSMSNSSMITSEASLETSVTSGTILSHSSDESTSSGTAEFSDAVELPSLEIYSDSNLSTTPWSSVSTSNRSGIDPRDLPAVIRTGTQQPLSNPLSDFYSSMMSSDVSNTSSNASTHTEQSDRSGESSTARNTFRPSWDVESVSVMTSSESRTATAGETTTATESFEEHAEFGSRQTGSAEPGLTTTEVSIYSSSVSEGVVTSISSRTDEESTEEPTKIESKQSGSQYNSSEYSSHSSGTTKTGEPTYSSSSGKIIITSISSRTGEGESSEEYRGIGSRQQSGSSYYSDSTRVGGLTYSSSSKKSTTISLSALTGEEEVATDLGEGSMLLSNINLAEALERSDPPISDFEDSDTLTSSSDEYITHRLMRDSLESFDWGVPDSTSITEPENLVTVPNEVLTKDNVQEASKGKGSVTLNTKNVPEVPLNIDMRDGILPVLQEEEELEEPDKEMDAQMEEAEEISDSFFYMEPENQNIEEESTVQEPSSGSSERSTSNDDRISSDEYSHPLLMVAVDKNEKVFEDILITKDVSPQSISSECSSINLSESRSLDVSDSTSLISYERKLIDLEPMAKTEYEVTITDVSSDVVHFALLHAVATIFIDLVINVAIKQLRFEVDYSRQMEKALFPVLQAESSEESVHWISPPRFGRKKFSNSEESSGIKGLGTSQIDPICEQGKDDEWNEELGVCLERAFFPCLAEEDELNTPELSIHLELSSDETLTGEMEQTDDESKPKKSEKFIGLAAHVSRVTSRVSSIAAATIAQVLGVVSCVSLTIWNYIRDSFTTSDVERRDEATQYDYTDDDESSTTNSQCDVMSHNVSEEKEDRCMTQQSSEFQQDINGWVTREEMGLQIFASRLVASALATAVWGKEYAMSPVPSELSNAFSENSHVSLEEINSKLSFLSFEPSRDIFGDDTLLSHDDNDIVVSASTVVEEAIGNAIMLHKSTRESASATPTELSTQSDNISVTSERSGNVDEDTVSALSLSDIPMSSIDFMRQELADIKSLFQATFSGITENSFTSTSPATMASSNGEVPNLHMREGAISQEDTEGFGPQIEYASLTNREIDDVEQLVEINMVQQVSELENRDNSSQISSELEKSTTNVAKDDAASVQLSQNIQSSGKSQVSHSESQTLDLESESNEVLRDLCLPERHDEENNDKDALESDSNSTSSSVLSLSDVPFTGISYIREQLASVKNLANSIMDDFNAYADERSLVAKRSSQLACTSSPMRSYSSCDSARTIGHNSSESSIRLNVQGESKFLKSMKSDSPKLFEEAPKPTDEEMGDHPKKETGVLKEEGKTFPITGGLLELANENCNAKTYNDEWKERETDDKEQEPKDENILDVQGKALANNTSAMHSALGDRKERESETNGVNQVTKESDSTMYQRDGMKSVQMTQMHEMRQVATLSRNSPARRHVTSKMKGSNNRHESYSGESSCSTDYNSSLVSPPSSSFSDGTESSGSRKVTIESESQSKGRTDVSCRISDRGIWVNTAFVNTIDEDHSKTMVAPGNATADEKLVRNKIKINVKMSPRSRKKHHSHHGRSRVRDTHLQIPPEGNQRTLALLEKETLKEDYKEVQIGEFSNPACKEVAGKIERDCLISAARRSLRAEDLPQKEEIVTNSCLRETKIPNAHKHQAEKTTEAQLSDQSEMAMVDRKDYWLTDQQSTMRECISDIVVSENRQPSGRSRHSQKRKQGDSEPHESVGYSPGEKSNHSDDLLAAPVISRSERTRAVLSMLDDVAGNLSTDKSDNDENGMAHSKGRIGSFQKFFSPRKHKRRNLKDSSTPDQSPRVKSDSSVTESDGDSGSPECSSDSSHTHRSHSSASLLSNVLRTLSAKRRKKKSKGACASTSRDYRSKKRSVAALDEMLGDFDGEFFIDDAFPELISVRDSPSEDSTSLNEVLHDFLDEWSFDGLQEALDSCPQSLSERLKEKLNRFMIAVRRERRRAEQLFGQFTTV